MTKLTAYFRCWCGGRARVRFPRQHAGKVVRVKHREHTFLAKLPSEIEGQLQTVADSVGEALLDMIGRLDWRGR